MDNYVWPTPKTSFDHILTRPPALDLILREISPASLVRIGQTSRLARAATSDFRRRAFNINHHISRFFSNPYSFRSLQARTATLISGSNALQFFDRTFYEGSDLDLYTNREFSVEVGLWLLEHGYSFVPNSYQENDFERASSILVMLSMGLTMVTSLDKAHAEMYEIPGVSAVYTFVKESDSKKVQIIATKESPLHTILNFHSTCVMNFIAFDCAYSLYPRATFEEREALLLAQPLDRNAAALAKYAMRGWAIAADIWPREGRTQPSFYPDVTRWVRDKFSWIIPLDTTGIPDLQPPPPFNTDPVIFNSWKLGKGYESKFQMKHYVIHSTILRYQYLVADSDLFDHIISFLNRQGLLEHSIAEVLGYQNQENFWTWWDSVIPGLIDDLQDRKNRKKFRRGRSSRVEETNVSIGGY